MKILQVLSALSRIAAALEEANTLTRMLHGLKDPGAPLGDLQADIIVATDEATYEYEQEEERLNRHR